MRTNVLLFGPIGTGKTRSLRTIVEETNKKLLVLATEPGIEHLIGPTSKEGDLHASGRCHWAEVLPARYEFDTLAKMAELTGRLDQKALASMGRVDRQEYTQWLDTYATLANFKCKHCGELLGPVDKLSEDWVFAIDGLTGLSVMAMDLIAGGRPMKDKPHYGLAQGNLMNLLRKLVNDMLCSFVLVAHAEKRINEVSGLLTLTVSSIGQAINNDILKPFDEVLWTHRDSKGQFWWSTTEQGVDLKTRRLPFSDEIKPSFAQLL